MTLSSFFRMPLTLASRHLAQPNRPRSDARSIRGTLSLRFLPPFLVFLLLSYSLPSSAEEVDADLKAKLMQAVAQADSFEDEFDAQVWLMQKSSVLKKYVKDPDKRLYLLRLIHREAKRADLPPEFVLAVIQVESHFDRFAFSHAGARGLMQVMPFWKNEIGRESDNLMNVETNLRYGCTILKHYLDRADGNWAEALARYNGSYGKIWYAEKVMVAWQTNWR